MIPQKRRILQNGTMKQNQIQQIQIANPSKPIERDFKEHMEQFSFVKWRQTKNKGSN